jgi:hypothetical protein
LEIFLSIIELNESQIYNTIKNGEFDKNILNSKKNVAVIMTQSWCYQWDYVKKWINDISENSEIDIYLIIYDNKKYYNDFLFFKENNFCNNEIPYIRYYKDSLLIKETNYTTKDFFLDTFLKN